MTSPSEAIVCPTCNAKADRVGAQDACDIYVCYQSHITRIKVGAPRNVWGEEKKEE